MIIIAIVITTDNTAFTYLVSTIVSMPIAHYVNNHPDWLHSRVIDSRHHIPLSSPWIPSLYCRQSSVIHNSESTCGRVAVVAPWTQDLRTASAVVNVTSSNGYRVGPFPSLHVAGGDRSWIYIVRCCRRRTSAVRLSLPCLLVAGGCRWPRHSSLGVRRHCRPPPGFAE